MKKLLSTTIAAGIFASAGISPVFALDINAVPKLSETANNELVKVTTPTDGYMNIQIDPDNQAQFAVGKAYWDEFNIGSNAHVNVEFTAHNQTSLNFVNAAGGQSQILGRFTDSGCNGCGFEGTGKVVLINPNGVLFGSGSNVNLNSFTASTYSGNYTQPDNSGAGTLVLTRTGNEQNGIKVLGGATIYGDKNVSFAAENVDVYSNSRISTNQGTLNVATSDSANGANDASLGKVKLVTSDGVNFKYYNSGAVEEMSNYGNTADKMRLWVAGTIESGQIELRNTSTHDDSQINVNGAALKAYKAEKGSDGNIWLVGKNKVIANGATFETANVGNTNTVLTREGGNVVISSVKKTTVGENSGINAVGNVSLLASNGNVNADRATISANDITLEASGVASVQNSSVLNGNDILVKGTTGGQIIGYGLDDNGNTVVSSNTVNGKNVKVEGGYVWLNGSTITADEKISGKSGTSYVLADGSVSLNAPEIEFDAKTDVLGVYNLNNNKTKLTAGNDVNVVLNNVSSRDNGLIANAGNNITITTPGTLSISRLYAQNGDVTLNAADIISGSPLNNISPETKFADTPEDRALIWVKNGTFTTNPAMTVTKSGGETIVKDDVTYNLKHNIEYGADGAEKVLLINPRIAQAANPNGDNTDVETLPGVDDSQATSRTRIPQLLEVYDNTTNISDGRTSFVDVFAAASQIEIDED